MPNTAAWYVLYGVPYAVMVLVAWHTLCAIRMAGRAEWLRVEWSEPAHRWIQRIAAERFDRVRWLLVLFAAGVACEAVIALWESQPDPGIADISVMGRFYPIMASVADRTLGLILLTILWSRTPQFGPDVRRVGAALLLSTAAVYSFLATIFLLAPPFPDA